jgi:SAM-dependent methyltransferase
MNSNPTRGRKAVIQNELLWHDKEAYRRLPIDALLYDSPAFDEVTEAGLRYLRLDHEELVLDMGCGEGRETLILSFKGPRVIGVDLSFNQLSRARSTLQAKNPEAKVNFVQANAEELPFANSSFSNIYGKAILHHLDLNLSVREVNRLLQKNGRATFAEPLARHPLFWLGRRLTPQLRTKDERPMLLTDLQRYSENFRIGETETFFFTAPLAYLVRMMPFGEHAFRIAHSFLSKVDRKLFSLVSEVQPFAWYGAIRVQK